MADRDEWKEQSEAVFPRRFWPAYLALTVIVLAMLLRPGDVPWVNDEPKLIEFAWALDQRPSQFLTLDLPFTIPMIGLQGTRGVNYGPAPLWFYQLCLGFTHNIEAIVVLRSFFVGALNAIALLWLARSLRLSPWLAVVTMLSPWIWIYTRQLWDNSFAIPITALLLASYADFINRRTAFSISLMFLCCWTLIFIHLMTVPLVIPILIHAFTLQFRAIWPFRWHLTVLGVAVFILTHPYVLFILFQHTPANPGGSPVEGWFFPLLGAHHLTAAGLGNILLDDWSFWLGVPWCAAVLISQWITLSAYALSWFGMILAALLAWRVFTRRREATAIHHIALVSMGALLAQAALDGIEETYDGPHYFNGTWIIFAVFAWIAADALGKWLWDRTVLIRAALPVYALALLVVLSGMLWKIARDGGTRDGGKMLVGYGTVFSQQLAAVEKIHQFDPDSPVALGFGQWYDFGFAYDNMLKVINLPPASGPLRKLTVRYRGPYPDAHLTVDSQPLETSR